MKHDTNKRFAFIETCLYWGMGLTAKHLGRVFGIARQNAQVVINNYKKVNPTAMTYNTSTKKQEMAKGFEPICLKRTLKSPKLYLDYLRGDSLRAHYIEDDNWNDDIEVVDVASYFKPNLDDESIRLIIHAIQYKKVLSIYYFSKNMSSHFLISPQHLVYANNRYHIRAYSHYEEDDWPYRDLVLSRIRGAEIEEGETWSVGGGDKAWANCQCLSFQPNPELPGQVIESISYDYPLENGVYKLEVREALIFYIKRDLLRIDLEHNLPLWIEA